MILWSHGLRLECQMLADDFVKQPRRMDGFKAAVEIGRSTNASMPQ
jgi:hypothetical protein